MVAVDYRSSHVGEGRAYHDKFSKGPYRSAIWDLEQAILVDLLERWCPRTDAKLLDFACGTGRILALLERRVGSAIGVDVSESMLGVARDHLLRAEVRRVDLTRDPTFADGSFDVITAFRFFPNAEPSLRDEAMHALARLLAPHGVLLLNNHLRQEGLRFRLRAWVGRIKRGGRRKAPVGMSDAEIAALAARHGLEIVEERSLALLPVLSEKRPMLPRAWIASFEARAARIPGLAPSASARIHALRHRS